MQLWDTSAVRYLPDNLCYEPLWSIISPYKEYPKLAEWQNPGSGQLIWLQDFSFVMLSLAVWFRSARANPGWVVRAWLQAHAFWSWQASRKQWRPGPIVICWANPSRKYLLYAAIFEITITCDYKLIFAGLFEFFALDTILRVLYHVEATDRLSRPALYVLRHLYNLPRLLILFGRRVDYHPQRAKLGYHLPLW